uniref:Uncharacterized protein n=1 Tax=Amphilophus citrinellus TaxID=61819 RepID=A0A3Q0SUH1_AMPCI
MDFKLFGNGLMSVKALGHPGHGSLDRLKRKQLEFFRLVKTFCPLGGCPEGLQLQPP